MDYRCRLVRKFIHCFGAWRPLGKIGLSYSLGLMDFIFSCPLYFFPCLRISSYLLLFVCLISFLLFPSTNSYWYRKTLEVLKNFTCYLEPSVCLLENLTKFSRLWQHLRRVLFVSCVWQTKKKMGNRLYYWSRLVQTHDQLIERLLSNASRGSNGYEPVCLDPFCALIG